MAEAILPLVHSLVGSAGEWEYLYDTIGKKVTRTMLDDKYLSYYKGNNWTRSKFDKATKGWVAAGKIVCGCQGVEDYYSKSDTSANNNYKKYCTDKGSCSAINRPYVLGEAVFNSISANKSHVGWVRGFIPDGDELVMEERGLSCGFVITRMSKRPWKYRGLITKCYKYDLSEKQTVTASAFTFTRVLKYGCRGDDVEELKSDLKKKGLRWAYPDKRKLLRLNQDGGQSLPKGQWPYH